LSVSVPFRIAAPGFLDRIRGISSIAGPRMVDSGPAGRSRFDGDHRQAARLRPPRALRSAGRAPGIPRSVVPVSSSAAQQPHSPNGRGVYDFGRTTRPLTLYSPTGAVKTLFLDQPDPSDHAAPTLPRFTGPARWRTAGCSVPDASIRIPPRRHSAENVEGGSNSSVRPAAPRTHRRISSAISAAGY
jgi:hypothetical protein